MAADQGQKLCRWGACSVLWQGLLSEPSAVRRKGAWEAELWNSDLNLQCAHFLGWLVRPGEIQVSEKSSSDTREVVSSSWSPGGATYPIFCYLGLKEVGS